jgi:protein SCO1/2
MLAMLTLALLAGAAGFRWLLNSHQNTIGGPYELLDTQQRRVTQANFRGHYTVLYFGYTHCIDICPLTLDTLSAALDRLGPEGRTIVPIFISVDPERDTPAVMRNYLARFSPRIVGLSGTPDQLKPVLKAFHVTVHRRDTKVPDYLIDHTSILYVIDRQNHLVGMIPVDDNVEQMATDLARLLHKN